MNPTIKNVLKWGVLAGLFFTPLIPFIVTKSLLFPFITGKGFTFRILIEIIFAFWALLALYEPEYRPNWNWIAKSLIVFLVVLFFADLFSKYSFKSFWSNYERMEGFVTIAHLVAYYFVISSMLKTEKLWKWFWDVTLGAGVIMSFYGFLQLAGKITINQGGVRLDATFGNASYLAIYMACNMFIALILLFKSNEKLWKWIYGVVFLLQAIILYYTATRGAILGFIGGILLAALIVAWQERKDDSQSKMARKLATWLLGIVVAVVLIFVAVRNTSYVQNSPVLSRFATISISSPENAGRSYVWPMAIKGFLTNPKTILVGWGQESFNYVFNQYYNPAMYNQEQWFDRTHDIVLDWLIAGGLLGLLAYAAMYLALGYILWKKSSFSLEEKALITGVIAAYIFNNIFVFDNLISYIFFFSILAWVSSRSSEPASVVPVLPKQFSKDTLNYFFTPIVGILLILCIYFVNVPAIQASTELISAISQQSSLDQNLTYFKDAFAKNSFGSPEILEQLVSLSIQAMSAPQTDSTIKQQFFDLTDAQIKIQIKKTPQDARYLLLAGSFYNRLGQYDTAIPYLTDAVKYSPMKPAMYFELGSSYIGKKDYAKAFDIFKQGYDLAPANPDAPIIYAIGGIYASKPDIVKQMFAVIGQDTVMNDDRILQAYVNIRDYNDAIATLNARLSKDPTNYNNELELASVYANAGNKAKAIQLIEDVEAKNPGSKTQLDPYIQQLQQ